MGITDSASTILLVDDDKIDTLTVQYLFREYNIKNTLVTAKDGVEALDKLYGLNNADPLTSIPKIILVDINMPRMNGFDFLRKLYSDPLYKAIPAIVITTSAANRDIAAAKELGVKGYFLKPLNFKEFFPLYKDIIETETSRDAAETSAQKKSLAKKQPKKILFIEDDAVDRMTIKKIFEEDETSACELIEADCAIQGLEICQNEKIDCILLDYLLPDMTGIAFLKKIKNNLNVPVIILTGAGDEGVAVSAMKEGAADYLIKSLLTPSILLKSIDNAIQKSAAELSLLEMNKNLEAILLHLAHVQNQLIQSEKMAAAGKMSAGIAHEMNNPLAYLVSNMEIFEKRVLILQKLFTYQRTLSTLTKDIPDEAIQKVNQQITDLYTHDKIETMTADLTDLITESKEGLLRIKKIISDLMIFAPQHNGEKNLVDINSCIESVLTTLAGEIENKISLRSKFGDLPKLPGYESKLILAFLNIVMNAIQSIEKQGEITITTQATASYIIITIKDNGVGIPAQDLNEVFTPFFTKRDVGAGMGLGLSNAYNIIKMHAGEIKVTSKLGKGTTVSIYLPLDS